MIRSCGRIRDSTGVGGEDAVPRLTHPVAGVRALSIAGNGRQPDPERDSGNGDDAMHIAAGPRNRLSLTARNARAQPHPTPGCDSRKDRIGWARQET